MITAMTGPLLLLRRRAACASRGRGDRAVGPTIGATVVDRDRRDRGGDRRADDRLAAPEPQEVGAQVVGGLVAVVRAPSRGRSG